jgi:7-cyano-7-deazaguanine synthase in queuosine biosynthesis
MIDTVVMLSGGVDSVAALHWAIEQKQNVAACNMVVNTDALTKEVIQKWRGPERKSRSLAWIINHRAQRQLCREICEYYNVKLFEVDYADNNMSVDKDYPWIHQRTWLAWQVGMLGVVNPTIKNFYYGLSQTDIENIHLVSGSERPYDSRFPLLNVEYIQRVVTAMGSSATVSSPLIHLTKQELYSILPVEIKEKLITCFFQDSVTKKPCGTCPKCKDFADIK